MYSSECYVFLVVQSENTFYQLSKCGLDVFKFPLPAIDRRFRICEVLNLVV